MSALSVSSAYELHDCAPSAQQELLLRAAIATGSVAREAWQQWLEQGDLEHMDAASFRLLPMVYRNLCRGSDVVPCGARLKVVYRHSWFRNQALFLQARQFLGELERAGIEPMLLKGGAMTLRHYRDDGVRYMVDLDVLVPRASFAAAVAAVAGAGWSPARIDGKRLLRLQQAAFQHGWGFRRNGSEVDLHAQLTRFVPMDEASLYEGAQNVDWRGTPVRLPSDTLLLYHACVHGARWSEAKLAWIPDALTLLGDEGSGIDWDVILDLARRTRMLCQLRHTLGYLVAEWEAAVPERVMAALQREPTSWVERREYAVMAKEHRRTPSVLLQRWYLRACRYRALASPLAAPLKPTLAGLVPYAYFYFLSGGAGQQ
jgi:hypothetical protein